MTCLVVTRSDYSTWQAFPRLDFMAAVGSVTRRRPLRGHLPRCLTHQNDLLGIRILAQYLLLLRCRNKPGKRQQPLRPAGTRGTAVTHD